MVSKCYHQIFRLLLRPSNSRRRAQYGKLLYNSTLSGESANLRCHPNDINGSICRSLKSILDALEEEYDNVVPSDTTPSPFRVLQRLRLSLSPLFFIELNLLKILSPDCVDCRGLTVRAGAAWQDVLSARIGKQGSGQGYDPTPVLVAQRNDIITLWRSAEIQEILARRCPKLKNSSGL